MAATNSKPKLCAARAWTLLMPPVPANAIFIVLLNREKGVLYALLKQRSVPAHSLKEPVLLCLQAGDFERFRPAKSPRRSIIPLDALYRWQVPSSSQHRASRPISVADFLPMQTVN